MKETLLKWIPTLAALVVILACARLAAWQLDRAAEKDLLMAEWENAPELMLEQVDAGTPRYARIRARGSFDARRQILLDNQLSAGRPGVHVFTPFVGDDDARVWLVNRGWAPLDRRSGTLPDPPAPPGPLALAGILDEPPRVGLRIGQVGPLDPATWPKLVTYYDHARLAEVFGELLAGRVILLDPDHPAHLDGREWTPVRFGPERHRAYAFQWGLIAVVVFGIWVVLTIRSRQNT